MGLLVRDLDWRYTIREPNDGYGEDDVYIAAYPVGGIRFVVGVDASSVDAEFFNAKPIVYSCLTILDVTWVVKFDLRSRSEMELYELSVRMIKAGVKLTNPECKFALVLREFPKV